MLMLPAPDASLVASRTTMLKRTVIACIRPIVPHSQPVLLIRVVVLQLFASRTAIDIFVFEIDEVLFAEPTLRLDPRCDRLWQRHGDAKVVARLDFLTIVVPAIRYGLKF